MEHDKVCNLKLNEGNRHVLNAMQIKRKKTKNGGIPISIG